MYWALALLQLYREHLLVYSALYITVSLFDIVSLQWHFFFLFASVPMVENLSNVSFRAILDHVQANFVDFLKLPHYKQMNLAERSLTELVKHDLLDLLQFKRIIRSCAKAFSRCWSVSRNHLLHVIYKHPLIKIKVLHWWTKNLHSKHSALNALSGFSKSMVL